MNAEVEIENLLQKLAKFRNKNISGCSVFNAKKEIRQRIYPLLNNNSLIFNVKNNEVEIVLNAENNLLYKKIYKIKALSEIEILDQKNFNFENIIKYFSLELSKKEKEKIIIKDIFMKKNKKKLQDLKNIITKKDSLAEEIKFKIKEIDKKVEEYKEKLCEEFKIKELFELQQTLYHERKDKESDLDNSLQKIAKKEKADFEEVKQFLKKNVY